MTTILVDCNMEGQARLLWSTIADEGWLELAPLRLVTFADVGLPANSPDRVVWRLTQARRLLLLTNNRNARGEDSLGQVIREETTATSLPVLTIGRMEHIAERGRGLHAIRVEAR